MVQKAVNGIFHVHTTYSHDGKCSIAELAGLCVERGLGFMMLSEHAEDFSPEKMKEFLAECIGVSESSGVIISPGLEFGFKEYPHLHLLGIGLSEYIPSIDIAATIAAIHGQGGLAVIAHPTRNRHFVPDHIREGLDGIEVWNAAYDSRYLPHHASIALLNEIRKQNPSAMAFGGLDMHRAADFKGVILSTNNAEDLSGLMGILRDGAFTISGRLLEIGARQRFGLLARNGIRAARLALESADSLAALGPTRWRKAAR